MAPACMLWQNGRAACVEELPPLLTSSGILDGGGKLAQPASRDPVLQELQSPGRARGCCYHSLMGLNQSSSYVGCVLSLRVALQATLQPNDPELPLARG